MQKPPISNYQEASFFVPGMRFSNLKIFLCYTFSIYDMKAPKQSLLNFFLYFLTTVKWPKTESSSIFQFIKIHLIYFKNIILIVSLVILNVLRKFKKITLTYISLLVCLIIKIIFNKEIRQILCITK